MKFFRPKQKNEKRKMLRNAKCSLLYKNALCFVAYAGSSLSSRVNKISAVCYVFCIYSMQKPVLHIKAAEAAYSAQNSSIMCKKNSCNTCFSKINDGFCSFTVLPIFELSESFIDFMSSKSEWCLNLDIIWNSSFFWRQTYRKSRR